MSRAAQTAHEPTSAGQPSLDRKALSGPALRTFFRIAELWGLSADEQMTLLGVTSRSTFFKWKRAQDVTLPKDTLERISYILGIYKALQVCCRMSALPIPGYVNRTLPPFLVGSRR